MALPIPIVHFLLVPGSILMGLILGAVRLAQREIVRRAIGSCPFCGTRQRLGSTAPAVDGNWTWERAEG